jgi:hypothetical protein
MKPVYIFNFFNSVKMVFHVKLSGFFITIIYSVQYHVGIVLCCSELLRSASPSLFVLSYFLLF